MESRTLREFATEYTAAWCSQSAASVAAFFAEGGSLKINEGAPSVGRKAITEAAQSFMTAFPDMVVTMDGITLEGAARRFSVDSHRDKHRSRWHRQCRAYQWV